MVLHIVTNITGCFVLDNSSIVDKILFKHPSDYNQRANYEKQLKSKHPEAIVVNEVLPKNKEQFEKYYFFNQELTQNTIKTSVKKDYLISAMVHIIEECDKVANIFSKRLRDILCVYLPEFEHKEQDNKKLVELAVSKTYNELKDAYQSNMNADLSANDWNIVISFLQQINSVYKLREDTLDSLETAMQNYCQNLNQVAGTFIGAKLIELVGGLEKLAEMRTGAIQLLGAEKAMFRHLTTKARCPKHGIIVNHPLIAKHKSSMHGRIARHLASAISKAVRIDYFKGDQYIGYKLKEELEKMFP